MNKKRRVSIRGGHVLNPQLRVEADPKGSLLIPEDMFQWALKQQDETIRLQDWLDRMYDRQVHSEGKDVTID